MTKKSLYNQQCRKCIGNHTNWQDSKQGNQEYQNKLVQRLSERPGLHTGNVHRQNATQAMVQLIAVLSSAQISSTAPANATKRTAESPKRPDTKFNTTTGLTLATDRIVATQYQSNSNPSASTHNIRTRAIDSAVMMSNSSTADAFARKNLDEVVFSPIEEIKHFHREQTRRVRVLLETNNLTADKHQPFSRVNNLVRYLAEGNSTDRVNEVAKTLSLPIGKYGLQPEDDISDEHKMALIAEYLNQQILGMSLDDWCVKQAQMMKSYQHLSFNNGYLQNAMYSVMSRSTRKGMLTREAQAYYQNNVLNKLLPSITLNLDEQALNELRNINISEPRWGFIHAGAKLLSDSGDDLKRLTLADFEDIGITLHAMLSNGAAPEEFIEYFRLPALLCYVKDIYVSDWRMLNEQDMQQVYQRYFDYIAYWEKKHNPFARLPDLIDNWKTRTALAKEQLTQHSVSDEWVESYLNSHGETQFETRKWVSMDLYDGTSFHEVKYPVASGTVSLPNIDTVFEEQNRKFADTACEVEKLVLPNVFDTLSEEEQLFIAQSKVDRVRLEFNAQASNWVSSPEALMTMIESNTFVYRISDDIDLLRCISDQETRLYVLVRDKDNNKITVKRVDNTRKALLNLLPDSKVPSRNADYKEMLLFDRTLKEKTETPQTLIDNLAGYHKEKLRTALYDKGYDKTTQEKIGEFLLGLVPFYTCISESMKGNIEEAAPACLIDIIFLIPFGGQAMSTYMRFGKALTRGGLMALRYGARQATLKEMVRQTGKAFIHHSPSIAKTINPQVIRKLGIAFLRGVDPGFELLASGGAKGIRKVQNLLRRIPNKSPGLTRLRKALRRKLAALSTHPNTKIKIESSLSPADGRAGTRIREETAASGPLSDDVLARETKNDVVRIISHGLFSKKDVVKRYIGDSNYIQYYTKFPNDKKRSEVLVLSAHGGFEIEDALGPAVVLPGDITIKMLTPHRTRLVDPHLNYVVNAQKKVKAFVSIRNGEVINVDFLPQKENPEWLRHENFDPTDIFNTLGREDGLQNYRHHRFEGESDKYIAKVLIKNRQRAKRGKAALTDILTVDSTISSSIDTTVEGASVQKIMDLDKAGKLLNEEGQRYKTIVFCHCRSPFFLPPNLLSSYFMDPVQLQAEALKIAARGSTVGEVKLTMLYRESANEGFKIKHYSLGRFIFTPLRQNLQSTMRPFEFDKFNRTN